MTEQPPPQKDFSFLISIWRQLRMVYHLMRDSEVPLYLKALPFGAVVYWLFPLEGLALPPLGTPIDDFALLAVGLKTFLMMAPDHVVERIEKQLDGNVIEGKWQPIQKGDVMDEIKIDPEDGSKSA